MTGLPTISPVRAVVFDLDDTLYLERDYVRSGYAAVLESLGGRLADPRAAAEWMWQRFAAGQAAGMFGALNDQFALGLARREIEVLVEVYRGHRPHIAPEAEAAAALAALRGRVKLGLLSDGFLPAQQLKLEALNLAGVFDAVLFTESLGRRFWKPDPTPFRLIAERLGIQPAGCTYVSDNLAKDFVAPNALGWRSLLWRRPGQVHADLAAPPGGQPQAVVHDHRQLLAALGLEPGKGLCP